MNTASQNLGHHLTVLQEKLQHATDYELALHYFLEEFAGDEKFILQCEPEEAPHLMAALAQTAAKALGSSAPLEQARAFRSPEFAFTHGNAAVAGRVRPATFIRRSPRRTITLTLFHWCGWRAPGTTNAGSPLILDPERRSQTAKSE